MQEENREKKIAIATGVCSTWDGETEDMTNEKSAAERRRERERGQHQEWIRIIYTKPHHNFRYCSQRNIFLLSVRSNKPANNLKEYILSAISRYCSLSLSTLHTTHTINFAILVEVLYVLRFHFHFASTRFSHGILQCHNADNYNLTHFECMPAHSLFTIYNVPHTIHYSSLLTIRYE